MASHVSESVQRFNPLHSRGNTWSRRFVKPAVNLGRLYAHPRYKPRGCWAYLEDGSIFIHPIKCLDHNAMESQLKTIQCFVNERRKAAKEDRPRIVIKQGDTDVLRILVRKPDIPCNCISPAPLPTSHYKRWLVKLDKSGSYLGSWRDNYYCEHGARPYSPFEELRLAPNEFRGTLINGVLQPNVRLGNGIYDLQVRHNTSGLASQDEERKGDQWEGSSEEREDREMKELTATSRKDKYRRGIEPNKKKFVDDMETLPTGSTGASSSSKRLPTLIYRPDSSISDYPSEYAGQSIGKTREFGGEARNLEGRGLNNRDAGLEACEQHVRHKDINQLRRQNQFLIERQAVLEGRLRKRPLPIRKVPVGIKDADGVTLRTRRVSMNPRDAASPSTLDNEERTPPLPPGASHTTNTDDVLSMAPEDKAHITDPSFFRVPPPQSLQTLRTNPKRVSKTQEGTNGTNRNVF